MPRPPKGWWDSTRSRYFARLGPPSGRTGKPTPVVLCHEDGRPIARGDNAAVAAAVRRLLAARDTTRAVATGPTVAEVAAAFVAWHRDHGSATRTVLGHCYHLNRFALVTHGGVAYGHRAATSIGPEDLWRVKGRGLGALRNLYASVLACWRWAARPVEGRMPVRLLPSNPLAGLGKPAKSPKVEKLVPWTTTRKLLRLARAWAKVPTRTHAAANRERRRLKALCLTTIALTGCRPFEAVDLRWDEIRWSEGIARIDPSRTKPRGRDRRIALPRQLLRALELIRPAGHPVWVFAAPTATQAPAVHTLIQWFRRDVLSLARSRSVPVPDGLTLYWLRHDWQSTGLEVASAEGVADAAGNSPQVLLGTYAHLKNRRIREVADAVARQRRRRVG